MAKRVTTEKKKKKVLYFDDEPFITSALARSLVFFDWDVTLISEIDGLFKELKSHRFDILMLDLMAPIPKKENKYINFTPKEIDEMDKGLNVGVVLAKKIWKDLKKDIPILFLSARRNPIPEDSDLNNHNCDYLSKPQLAKNVDEKLRDMLIIKLRQNGKIKKNN